MQSGEPLYLSRRGIRELATLALGLVLATGCGKEEQSKSLICDRSSYIRQSGEFKPDEGKKIRPVSSAQPIAKGYFGKPYNQDWLRNVGTASMNDTIEYIESKGADVYQSKAISEESARNFTHARLLPWELEKRWRESDSARRSEGCAFLGGLYLLKDPNVEALKKKAAIIIREDGNRWTLVHEFMHHNFKVQSVAGGFDDREVQGDRIEGMTKVHQYLSDRKLSEKLKAERAIPEFMKAVSAIHELILEYAFEEIAIEAMLQDAYDEGTLDYVPAGAYANASLYIEASKKAAGRIYEGMDETYTALRRMSSMNGLWDEYHSLADYLAMKEKRQSQLKAMFAARDAARGMSAKNPNVITSSDAARPKKKKKGAGMLVSASGGEEAALAPCGHAMALDLKMNDVIRALDAMNRN